MNKNQPMASEYSQWLKFKRYLSEYNCSPSIDSFKSFLGYYTAINQELLITHKLCGNSFHINIQDFLNIRVTKVKNKDGFKYISLCSTCKTKFKNSNFQEKINKHKLDFINLIGDYIDDYTPTLFFNTLKDEAFLTAPQNIFRRNFTCETKGISEKKINSIYQDKLDSIHKGAFSLIGNYRDNNLTVSLKHNKCGDLFTEYKRNLFKDTIHCPNCDEKRFKRNTSISITKRMKLYEKTLGYKYTFTEPFLTTTQTINVRCNKCNHIFPSKAKNLMARKDSNICPECDRLNRLSSYKKQLDDRYKKDIITINAEKDFKTKKSSLQFKHIKCETIFISSFYELLDKKPYICLNCEDESEIYTKKFSAEVYNKYKGEYIVKGQYIDSKTKILIKHNCNNVFSITRPNFLKAKIPCPKCRQKSQILGLAKFQARLNNKFGKLFIASGKYINTLSKLEITCNSCKTNFPSTPAGMLKRKKCPKCKVQYL